MVVDTVLFDSRIYVCEPTNDVIRQPKLYAIIKEMIRKNRDFAFVSS